ncbi:MAG: hypothetical protein QM652_08850 [Legionella sp.]|uniref:hypothetical protein n=1 Tax=Legionella sp. TaxID=459 RepID=UPI0039E3ABCB
MSKSLQKKIQALLARVLFPTVQQDWYLTKGYGKEGVESFANFLNQQYTDLRAIYYKDFKELEIKREFVNCHDSRRNSLKLDSISFTPLYSENQEGEGIHIINFFGRGEYYECNFKDMARQAKATGATIHAYNPPGMNSSTGKVLEFKDLINAGIAQVNHLLKQGVHPDQIIIQGNCLGAAVAEEVNKCFNEQCNINFRRINSNSFKSISALLTKMYQPLALMKDTLKKLLNYAGWYTKPGALFKETGPYKVYMRRAGDETIALSVTMHMKVEKEKRRKAIVSDQDINQDYEKERKWLDEHAIMELDDEHYAKDKKINPHELDLYKLRAKHPDHCSAFDFVNRYIKASNEYITKHPQKWDSLRPQQACYIMEDKHFFWADEQLQDVYEQISEIVTDPIMEQQHQAWVIDRYDK